MGQWWKVHKFKSALEWYRAKLTTTGWITQTYHQRCWSCLNQEGTGKTWQDSDLVESVEIVKGAGRSLSCSRVQEGQAILVDMEREREGCGNRTLSIEFWWEVYFADHASGLLGLANCKNCVPSSLGAEYANIFWTDSKPSSQSSRFTTWRCCQRITMIIM
jgi:hypothetical protein